MRSHFALLAQEFLSGLQFFDLPPRDHERRLAGLKLLPGFDGTLVGHQNLLVGWPCAAERQVDHLLGVGRNCFESVYEIIVALAHLAVLRHDALHQLNVATPQKLGRLVS